jgi:hypothetical protein
MAAGADSVSGYYKGSDGHRLRDNGEVPVAVSDEAVLPAPKRANRR